MAGKKSCPCEAIHGQPNWPRCESHGTNRCAEADDSEQGRDRSNNASYPRADSSRLTILRTIHQFKMARKCNWPSLCEVEEAVCSCCQEKANHISSFLSSYSIEGCSIAAQVVMVETGLTSPLILPDVRTHLAENGLATMNALLR
jgi:hypothetical protein